MCGIHWGLPAFRHSLHSLAPQSPPPRSPVRPVPTSTRRPASRPLSGPAALALSAQPHRAACDRGSANPLAATSRPAHPTSGRAPPPLESLPRGGRLGVGTPGPGTKAIRCGVKGDVQYRIPGRVIEAGGRRDKGRVKSLSRWGKGR